MAQHYRTSEDGEKQGKPKRSRISIGLCVELLPVIEPQQPHLASEDASAIDVVLAVPVHHARIGAGSKALSMGKFPRRNMHRLATDGGRPSERPRINPS